MKRRILQLILVLSSFFGASAQTSNPLSLKECVDIALQNNLRVRRSIYNVQSFNINKTQSMAAFLPTVNAGASYGLNFGRALNPVTNAYIARDSKTLNAQVGANWLLFNGLRIQNTFRQSQREFDASNQDLEKAKNDVIINVVTLYINVIFNKELYENATYQLNSSQQQLERIRKQVAAGSLPKANELNQEAQVATNEVNQINQENALNQSLLLLKQAMQLPASTPLDVVIQEVTTEDLILDQTPDAVYDIALKSMPEIKSAALKVESSQFALKASKGNLYPRLTLNAGAQSNYSNASNKDYAVPDGTYSFTSVPIGEARVPAIPPFIPAATQFPVYGAIPNMTLFAEKYTVQDQLTDNLFKQASLTLSIPIFNGLQTRSSVQRAAVNSEIARINETEAQNTLRQSIETAYNDAIASSRTYASSLKQVNAREEAARMNKQRFELGAISIVEYQISENDLFQAKSDLTRAKYNFIFKKKILDFYQGKTIEY